MPFLVLSDVAELLKTPGKLRGQKTPRTGRKQVRSAAPGREVCICDF